MTDTHPAILLFLKAPREHTVKTRLAKTIGSTDALSAYRKLAEFQLKRLPAAWPIQLHYTPAEAKPEMQEWLGAEHAFIAQPTGDLGERLTFAVKRHFEQSEQPAFLIGTDCPQLDANLFEEAAAQLRQADLVLGPAQDGGYYLMGLRSPHPELFQNIDWGTETVLEQTQAAAGEQGLNVALLQTLSDVDNEAEWTAAKAQFPELAR